MRLRYIEKQERGIKRIRNGKGFRYVGPTGRPVSKANLLRIKRLVIPPAWEDVWICAASNGHLQATGRDARGRKQYRYHDQWRAKRDETKFSRLLPFLRALPTIEVQTRRDLKLRGLPRRKVVATLVRLLETTFIRIGNEEYARDNDSFGLTTIRNRHVHVHGKTIRFRFRGKSGRHHDILTKDRRVAAIVRRCKELPGAKVFQYMDRQGQVCTIDSGDVNEYLRRITGEEFSAKDFRTFAGTALAATRLAQLLAQDPKRRSKRDINRVVEYVAEKLGNRPATCRKYYIHPALLESYSTGKLPASFVHRRSGLLAGRRPLMTFLRRHQ